MSLQRDIDWYDEEERDVDFVQHLVEELLAERERLRSVLHAFKSASDTTHSERRPGMSSFEELRDQWIHDHVPSATLSLHYVFEAAENRIAALEAEVERLQGRRCSTCSWLRARLGQYDCNGVSELRECPDPDDFGCNRWAGREDRP